MPRLDLTWWCTVERWLWRLVLVLGAVGGGAVLIWEFGGRW